MIAIWLLASWVAVAEPSGDRAGSPRAAAAPLAVVGELPAAWVPRLQSALGRGLRDLEVESLDHGAADCDDECWSARGRATGREVVLVPSLVAHGNLFDLEMRVVDTASAEVIARRSETCKPCGRADVEALVERQAASLSDWLRTSEREHVLVVDATPASAVVHLDGRRVATVPVDVRLPRGQHVIVVSAEGHAPRRRTFTTVRGVTEQWTVSLDPIARRPPVRRDRLWPIGWATLGTGVVALGGGATLLALHHRPYRRQCDGPDYDPKNDVCRRRYATLPYGAVLTAVGGAALATGIVLAVAGHRRRRGADRSLDLGTEVSPVGASALITGRF
jgi:hypothetical protein